MATFGARNMPEVMEWLALHKWELAGKGFKCPSCRSHKDDPGAMKQRPQRLPRQASYGIGPGFPSRKKETV